MGPITVRAALTFSRNVPAIKIAMRTGIENIIETARRAGIKSRMQPLLSLALGAQAFTPLEVAAAYATFARRGISSDPSRNCKITDSKGRVLELRPITKLSRKRYCDTCRYHDRRCPLWYWCCCKYSRQSDCCKQVPLMGSRDIWFTVLPLIQ